jgi:hypothetical protein
MTQSSVKKVIRVRKEDAVFIYFILESYEGWTSYSTLPFQKGDAFRDLELNIAPDYRAEVEGLLKQLENQVYEIRAEKKIK